MPTDNQNLKPTAVSDWGKAPSTDPGFIVTLPSGSVVRARRTLDLPVLLKAGKIPNPLATIVGEMIEKRQVNFPQEAANDPRAVQQLYELLDQTWMRAVLEPAFAAPEERKEGETWEQYTDRVREWDVPRDEDGNPLAISIFSVELTDKFYIFSIAQGAAVDLARFHSESAAMLGPVADGEGSPLSPVGTGGAGGNRATRRAAAKRSGGAKKSAAKRA